MTEKMRESAAEMEQNGFPQQADYLRMMADQFEKEGVPERFEHNDELTDSWKKTKRLLETALEEPGSAFLSTAKLASLLENNSDLSKNARSYIGRAIAGINENGNDSIYHLLLESRSINALSRNGLTTISKANKVLAKPGGERGLTTPESREKIVLAIENFKQRKDISQNRKEGVGLPESKTTAKLSQEERSRLSLNELILLEIGEIYDEVRDEGSPYIDQAKLKAKLSNELRPAVREYIQEGVKSIDLQGNESIYHLGPFPKRLIKALERRAYIETISELLEKANESYGLTNIEGIGDDYRDDIMVVLTNFIERKKILDKNNNDYQI